MDTTAVLQVDFVENFSTFWQDEVQSAHWHKEQVTVFTAALWQNKECKSAVVISDDLNHCKESVLVFVETLLTNLLQDDIKVVHIWSDGPSSQFKNRFVAAALPWLEKQCKVKIDWNFFAASHGKGPVDVSGGTIKRMASTEIIKRRAIINDAKSFLGRVKNLSKINVSFKTAREVQNRVGIPELADAISCAPSLPGIYSAHYFKNSCGSVDMRSYTFASYQVNGQPVVGPVSPEINPLSPVDQSTISIQCGSFVIVPYEFATSSRSLVMKKVLAFVTKSSGAILEVQYAKPISRRRVKMTPEDKGVVNKNDVLSVLTCPILKRGVYEFDKELDIDML